MDAELRKYDAIRPFEPEELPEVFDRLLADAQFQQVLTYLFPGVPLETIGQKMKACRSSLEFQKAFCYGFVKDLMGRASKGFDMDSSAISNQGRYTFVSNHRDIVLDSAILDVLLLDAGFTTTCEIAIGDNLLSLPWVKDLVRLNKSFIVQRGASMREMLVASKQLSDYMHYAISVKKENIWIAQRSGRAKDSDDRTAESVLKMMAMGGEGTVAERLMQLHIVPLTISYEYDPCDYLKAKELQQRRDNPNFQKAPGDDVLSMKTGIMGFKGRVHYHCSPCLDEILAPFPADLPKSEVFGLVATYIDGQIHRGYRLYPCNFIALDKLQGTQIFSDHYTEEDEAFFNKYLKNQMDKIDLEDRDDDFLLEAMLKQYANPAINFMAAGGTI